MLPCSQGWLWVVIHTSTEIKGHEHPIVLSSLRRFHTLFHNDSSNYSSPIEDENIFSLSAFCVLGVVCPFNSWFPRFLWWYLIIILICWAIIIDILRLHLLIIVFLPFEKCSDHYPFFFHATSIWPFAHFFQWDYMGLLLLFEFLIIDINLMSDE